VAVNWWDVTFGTARRGLGETVVHPKPLLALPNVRTHPSMASVPITILLYSGMLLCSFNLNIKE